MRQLKDWDNLYAGLFASPFAAHLASLRGAREELP